jgi:hypothetical protein
MNINMISTALLAVFALGVGNLDARGFGGGGHSGGDHQFSRSHHFGGMSHMGSHSNHQPAHSAFHHPDSASQKANAGKTQQKAKKKKGVSQQQHPKAHNAINNHPNAMNRAKNAVHHNGAHRHGNLNHDLNNDHLGNDHNNNDHNWNGNGWNPGWAGAGLAAGALALGGVEAAAMTGAAAGSAGNIGFIETPEIIAVPQSPVLGESVVEEVAPVREYHIEHDGAASADKQSPKHRTHYDDKMEEITEDEYEEYSSDQKIFKKNPSTNVANTTPPVVIQNITLGQPLSMPTKPPSMPTKPPSMPAKLTADMISTAAYSLNNTLSQADVGNQKTSAAP